MPPDDEATPSQPAPPPQADDPGPRVQSTVTVQDNQGSVTGVLYDQSGATVQGNVYNVAGGLTIADPARLAVSLHRLRAPVGDFVGRAAEIEQLVQALSTATGAGA